MATESFFKTIHIEDNSKADQFLTDIENPFSYFDYIKPSPTENNTQKVIEAWFKLGTIS